MAGTYTTIDEVRGELQTLVADTGPVTDADLTRWIQDAGRWIDSTLGRMYAVPITTPLSGPTEILETIARDWVVSRALRKHFSDRAFGDSTQWETYQKSAEDALKMVAGGNLFNGYAALPTVVNGRTIGVMVGGVVDNAVQRIDVLLAEHDRTTGVVLTPEETAILAAEQP